MVNAYNISVEVHGQQILHDISCVLPAGSITVFIGKSGAGKTTLLKTLAGLIAAKSGVITLNDTQIQTLSCAQRYKHVGYIFQQFNVFPHLTVYQNCIDPLIVHGLDTQQSYKRVADLLTLFDMSLQVNKYPAQLSGGQQQRVAIIRALSLKPQLMLLDEPTASLDPLNTIILVDILKGLAAQGLTIGLSSQDMNFVNMIFDRVYYMDSGRIVDLCPARAEVKEGSLIAQFLAQ